MKQGWEVKKLGEIAKATYGYTEKASYENIGPKFLRITDIQEDGVNWDTVPFCKINDTDLEKYKLIDGDIVFARTGATTGKSYLVNNPPKSVFASYLIKVHINYKGLSPEYLFLFFQTKTYWDSINAGISGSAQGGFNASKLSELKIPLPPLPEQQRIVAILDEAFTAIESGKANAMQNLKNAKELFDSYLQSVFENRGEGWEEKTLGEVCEFTQGIQRDIKLQSEIQQENQIRFLRIVDFTQGNELPRYIDNPGEKYILNEKDVSLVRYGASTGFVCRGLQGALANNLFRVIPKSSKQLSNDFLFIFLKSPVFQNVIKKSMNGAAMPAISFGMIKDIPFPIISLKEQELIVQKLDLLSAETKRLEAIYQQKIDNLEELKKSILQKAFNGEL